MYRPCRAIQGVTTMLHSITRGRSLFTQVSFHIYTSFFTYFAYLRAVQCNLRRLLWSTLDCSYYCKWSYSRSHLSEQLFLFLFSYFSMGTRGGRQTKDCSQTWIFDFQFRLGKHFSDERGILFYYLKVVFLEYLRTSGEIRYPNETIGYWKKVIIGNEACIVHVGAVTNDYHGEGAIESSKCHSWKDCPTDLTSSNTNNVNFCTRSRPYQREASRPLARSGFF